MNCEELSFCESTATPDQIHAHLCESEGTFVPPLGLRVVLRDYATKIAENAVTFEAWAGGALVGLVAAYLNDPVRRVAFVSNVSVVPSFAGRGIAAALMRRCERRSVRDGFACMELEVARTNERAVRLYRRFGFIESGGQGEHMHMTKIMPTQSNQ